jgi:single-strand DNA-binding protein
MSLNKCMIIGNLGRDPEMRYTPSGQAVTQFTVATNRRWQTNGEWQEETEWFRVVVWGQQAERTAERLRKGNKVYVEGRIQTRQWEDQTGAKRYTTELVADRVTSLERRERDEDAQFGGEDRPSGAAGPGPSSGSRPAPSGPAASAGSSGDEGEFDDLPF